MGKVTGFLEYEREDRDYEAVDERIRHWREFVLPLPEQDYRTQAARCMNCGVPFCQGTGSLTPGTPGCPVNNQIPDWNDLVYAGDWDEAARNLHSTNNFPEVTGRVCPAPCEASCTLNIDDNPVTIKSIECAIADRAIARGLIPEAPSTKTGKTVAIVGSGPAGLACAQQLARAGHSVHVYEKYAKDHGQSPAAPEALYAAAWRRSALIEIYKTEANQKKSEESKARALALAQKIVSDYGQSDWATRAQTLIFYIQNNVPTFGNASD